MKLGRERKPKAKKKLDGFDWIANWYGNPGHLLLEKNAKEQRLKERLDKDNQCREKRWNELRRTWMAIEK